jgi:hypothetical protein
MITASLRTTFMKKSAWIGVCAVAALGATLRMSPQAAGQARMAGAQVPSPEIDKEKIRVHVKFLASDLFEGRLAG